MIIISQQNGYRSAVFVLSDNTIGNISAGLQFVHLGEEQAVVRVWAGNDAY